MYAAPDVDEVLAVAKELGIHLGPEEVVLYRKYLLEQLRELDTFVQARGPARFGGRGTRFRATRPIRRGQAGVRSAVRRAPPMCGR